ncbi:hypothetical protein Pint_31765 [Pistacia integerrima]|uniref:Uncharacterized protein n=1 Tax=Pistacia integerrima TaxID=434235 RepID=A0ACC0XR04_9ROSI|nr:hypothetical protein Pint_31765 [Pistacia integerrima]
MLLQQPAATLCQSSVKGISVFFNLFLPICFFNLFVDVLILGCLMECCHLICVHGISQSQQATQRTVAPCLSQLILQLFHHFI